MTDKALPRVEMDDNCLNECFYADERPMQKDRCTLHLVPNFIRVEYDDDGKMIYRGEEIGVGHFELSCPKRDGTGTLHRSPNDQTIYESFFRAKEGRAECGAFTAAARDLASEAPPRDAGRTLNQAKGPCI